MHITYACMLVSAFACNSSSVGSVSIGSRYVYIVLYIRTTVYLHINVCLDA